MSVCFALTYVLWAAIAPELVEEGTLRLYYLKLPLGYERYSLARDGDDLLLTSNFDFTDRGGRVQLEASLRMAGDLTPPPAVRSQGQELPLRERGQRGHSRIRLRFGASSERNEPRTDSRTGLHRRRIRAVLRTGDASETAPRGLFPTGSRGAGTPRETESRAELFACQSVDSLDPGPATGTFVAAIVRPCDSSVSPVSFSR
jgi:hypothetical protein